MVTIRMSNQIEIRASELPTNAWKQIKNDLTLANPEYAQAVKFGHNTHGKPASIELFRRDGEFLVLPRGYGRRLVIHLQADNIAFNFEDHRLILPRVNFNSVIQLRNYQESAVNEFVKWKIGGIVAPCGAGKTMIGLEALARIGQPALWVTHTKELADQVIERACSVFDLIKDEIGFIGDGKFRIGDRLTVALIQTLSKSDIDEFKHRFGALFIDEAHHLAARSFFYPVGQFPAMYRLWVSATPDRADGLTDMVIAAGGQILHTIEQSEVPTIIPKLEVIETDFSCRETEYVDIVSSLIRNETRNELLVETVAAQSDGNYCLVLSDRTEHLDILKALLRKRLPDKTIEVLTGAMKKKDRADVMELVKVKKVDILLATQLAREGLDIVHLNRLFLATPKRAAAAVQQEVGRVMRPAPGKDEAVVYDFWDTKNGILKSQFWKRREVYKKIGMDTQPRGSNYKSV